MVYSTCSFNPIENEAVVAELLRRCDGGLELVDVSDRLPGLIRFPGVSNWKVSSNKTITWYKSMEEVPPNAKSIKASFFPPTADEIKRFHLDRCMRMLPQSQDTGGFFVALLRKTKLVDVKKIHFPKGEKERTDAADGSGSGSGSGGAADGSAAGLAHTKGATRRVAAEDEEEYFGEGGEDDMVVGGYDDGGDGAAGGGGGEEVKRGPDGGHGRRGSRKNKYNVESTSILRNSIQFVR